MNKKYKYAINGSLIFGVGNAILNAINQLNKMDQYPEKTFDWRELFGAATKGAMLGGVGGFAIGAVADHQNSLEKPINTDAHLFSLINSIRLNQNNSEYKTLNDKATKLTSILKKEFGDLLTNEPIRLGSTENGTALVDGFDIDICLPFKPRSFSSTNEMYSSLNMVLNKYVGRKSIVEIRNQKKSIGVILEHYGQKRRIDIVPIKLTDKNGNFTSGYLYVNNSNKPTYTKTDIQALKNFGLTETQKKIVVVLKHWKRKYSVPISSHLLQNLVVDAYERNYVPKTFTKKIIMVFEHIRDKMNVAVIKSIENTNNVLTNIPDSKKDAIVAASKKMIEEYKYQPNSIVTFLA